MSPTFIEVQASRLRNISCGQADKVGRPFYRANTTLPAQYLPPLPGGVPGGRGKPFGFSTPIGHVTCHIAARGSDFAVGDCYGATVSMHLYVHRDCCHRAQGASSAGASSDTSSTTSIRCTNAAVAGGGCGIAAESVYARSASLIPGDHNPNDASSAQCGTGTQMEIGPHADCSVALKVSGDLAQGKWSAPGTDTGSEGSNTIMFNCSVVGQGPPPAEAGIYSCISDGDPQDWFKFGFT